MPKSLLSPRMQFVFASAACLLQLLFIAICYFENVKISFQEQSVYSGLIASSSLLLLGILKFEVGEVILAILFFALTISYTLVYQSMWSFDLVFNSFATLSASLVYTCILFIKASNNYEAPSSKQDTT